MVPVLSASPVVEPLSRAAAADITAAPAITLDAVSLSYPGTKGAVCPILESISLAIEPGEFVVVLGRTGCGKSTLLRLLLGQEPPTSGRISLAGRVVARVDSRSAYVPQRYSLFPDRTVLENVMFGPETVRFHTIQRLLWPKLRAFRRELRVVAMEQLHRMGLGEADARKYPHQLSGGMQQRVAIVQALVMRARVLLLDEAFSALDPGTRTSLQRLLRSVWEEQRPTVVFVTHNVQEALFLGTRLIVLARPVAEQGSRVVLDRRLPAEGMTLARHGREYLDLVESIEQHSHSGQSSSSPGESA